MEQLNLSNYPYAKIFRIKKTEIEKIDFALCNQPRETLESFYNRQTNKPDLLVNGGFFSMSDGNTIFTYMDEGQMISTYSDYLYGFGIIGDTNLIASNFSYDMRDFISAYPILIKDGLASSGTVGNELNYNARRTVLAYNDIYIFVILVENPGMTLTAVKNMLLGLNVNQAINLDGGGSTRCLKNGIRVTENLYSRPVDNVVAIYLKKEQEQPKIIYRVQTGAFSKQENAERYKAEIRSLHDTIGAGYKNAYVRYINGLYKVQVGAFSLKANALKVVEDLARKGYNSFITT